MNETLKEREARLVATTRLIIDIGMQETYSVGELCTVVFAALRSLYLKSSVMHVDGMTQSRAIIRKQIASLEDLLCRSREELLVLDGILERQGSVSETDITS